MDFSWEAWRELGDRLFEALREGDASILPLMSAWEIINAKLMQGEDEAVCDPGSFPRPELPPQSPRGRLCPTPPPGSGAAGSGPLPPVGAGAEPCPAVAAAARAHTALTALGADGSERPPAGSSPPVQPALPGGDGPPALAGPLAPEREVPSAGPSTMPVPSSIRLPGQSRPLKRWVWCWPVRPKWSDRDPPAEREPSAPATPEEEVVPAPPFSPMLEADLPAEARSGPPFSALAEAGPPCLISSVSSFVRPEVVLTPALDPTDGPLPSAFPAASPLPPCADSNDGFALTLDGGAAGAGFISAVGTGGGSAGAEVSELHSIVKREELKICNDDTQMKEAQVFPVTDPVPIVGQRDWKKRKKISKRSCKRSCC